MPKARSIVEVLAAEAIGTSGRSRDDVLEDMLHIASVISNRSKITGVPPQRIVANQKEFNAYGKDMPDGSTGLGMQLAQAAWAEIQRTGPVSHATYYATPAKKGNLPDGLESVFNSPGHQFFSDPQNRSFRVEPGYGVTGSSGTQWATPSDVIPTADQVRAALPAPNPMKLASASVTPQTASRSLTRSGIPDDVRDYQHIDFIQNTPGRIRGQPSNALTANAVEDALIEMSAAAGKKITFQANSVGQAAPKSSRPDFRYSGSSSRQGSPRHNFGHALDGGLFVNGQRVEPTDDVKLYAEFAKQTAKRGLIGQGVYNYTGVGAGAYHVGTHVMAPQVASRGSFARDLQFWNGTTADNAHGDKEVVDAIREGFLEGVGLARDAGILTGAGMPTPQYKPDALDTSKDPVVADVWDGDFDELAGVEPSKEYTEALMATDPEATKPFNDGPGIAAGTFTSPYEPNAGKPSMPAQQNSLGFGGLPNAQPAGTPTSGYDLPNRVAAGTPTSGYDLPNRVAAGTPTAPYEPGAAGPIGPAASLPAMPSGQVDIESLPDLQPPSIGEDPDGFKSDQWYRDQRKQAADGKMPINGPGTLINNNPLGIPTMAMNRPVPGIGIPTPRPGNMAVGFRPTPDMGPAGWSAAPINTPAPFVAPYSPPASVPDAMKGFNVLGEAEAKLSARQPQTFETMNWPGSAPPEPYEHPDFGKSIDVLNEAETRLSQPQYNTTDWPSWQPSPMSGSHGNGFVGMGENFAAGGGGWNGAQISGSQVKGPIARDMDPLGGYDPKSVYNTAMREREMAAVPAAPAAPVAGKINTGKDFMGDLGKPLPVDLTGNWQGLPSLDIDLPTVPGIDKVPVPSIAPREVGKNTVRTSGGKNGEYGPETKIDGLEWDPAVGAMVPAKEEVWKGPLPSNPVFGDTWRGWGAGGRLSKTLERLGHFGPSGMLGRMAGMQHVNVPLPAFPGTVQAAAPIAAAGGGGGYSAPAGYASAQGSGLTHPGAISPVGTAQIGYNSIGGYGGPTHSVANSHGATTQMNSDFSRSYGGPGTTGFGGFF
jgi:hypothetical protein